MIRDEVRTRLCRLIPIFGVGRQTSDILTAFETLCGESLAIDASARSPERSRINADGTPFQISLDLTGDGAPALQFLGEAGRLEDGAGARRTASEAAIRVLARLCDVEVPLEAVWQRLQRLAPAARDAATAPTSTFWVALRFAPHGPPAVTVYANGAWGREDDRWRRCAELAADMDAGERWRRVATEAGALSPLGAAITLRRASPPRARVYLRGYGRPLQTYRDAMASVTPAHEADAALSTCARALLGDAARRPTPSAVFSLDLGNDPTAGAKLEFCAHCAFDDDAVAGERIGRWLRAAGFGDAPYHDVVAVLTEGRPPAVSGVRPSLHAFVGVGVRTGTSYASVYLNPGAVLGAA